MRERNNVWVWVSPQALIKVPCFWAVSLGCGGLYFHLSNRHLYCCSQMETRKRLAKIVLVFVACFVFCWFPNHVLYLYRSFNYKEIDPSLGHMIVTLVARVLSFSNSCVNPFALYLLSESFRKHFNSQLCCRRKSYPERSTSYLLSSSAVRMTSLKSNTKNMVTSSVLLNGHSAKQEIALWLEAIQPTLGKPLTDFAIIIVQNGTK